jgi:hypothetical protein
MLQSDDVGGAPLLDFESWRALLRSNCGRDVEVTAPNAFAGWRRPFNVCGLEATSVKIRWADPGCSDHRVKRYRDVRCDGADHYLILFQVAGQTAMTQMDQEAQLAVGDVALVDAARPVTYLFSGDWLTLRLPRKSVRSHFGFEPQGGVSRQRTRASRLLFDLIRNADMEAASSSVHILEGTVTFIGGSDVGFEVPGLGTFVGRIRTSTHCEKFGYGVISECRFRVTDVALWVKMAADVSYGDFGLMGRHGVARL